MDRIVSGSLNVERKGETFAAGGVAGAALNLYPNGTYARRIVVVSEYGWTLEGDALMLAPLLAQTDTGSRLEDGRLFVHFERRLPPLELERGVANPAQ